MKLLTQLMRYEHKEWIKLHKLHVGAAGLLTTTAIVAGVFVLSNSNSTNAASANTAYKQSNKTSQTSNTSQQVASATTQPTTQGSTSPSTGVSGGNTTHISTSTPTTTNRSVTTGSTTSNLTSPAPTTPTTPTTTQPPTLEQQYSNDYPSKWATPNIDTVIDTWGMSNRESTSYTAWKVNEAFGNMPYGWGNATNWPQEAQATGFSLSTTPKLHAVAIDTANAHGATGTGFSAWVEAVNGNQVTVSEYNWGSTGNYDVKTIPVSSFSTYIYFN